MERKGEEGDAQIARETITHFASASIKQKYNLAILTNPFSDGAQRSKRARRRSLNALAWQQAKLLPLPRPHEGPWNNRVIYRII